MHQDFPLRNRFSNKENNVENSRATQRSGDLYLIAAVFAWGINFPIAKYALQYLDPIIFSATRYFVASLLLFAILLLRKAPIAVSLKEVRLLIIVGLLGVTFFQGGWAFGLKITSASKASILITTSPIFAALISTVRGNRPRILSWFGIILAFLGVAVVINNSLTTITIGAGAIAGDLLIIGAAFLWAVYTFVSRPIVSRRGAIIVNAWSMLFGSAILGLAGISSFGSQEWQMIPMPGWIALGYSAIFGAALGFVWYISGIVRIGVTRGIVYGYFIPVVAILTSVLFFGEVVTYTQLVGAAIVLVGVGLVRSS